MAMENMRSANEVQITELEREARRQQERADTASRALQAAEKQIEQAAASSELCLLKLTFGLLPVHVLTAHCMR